MEYYSAIKKTAFESVLMRWMKLEPIIQSEVSQKEKHLYNILMHINVKEGSEKVGLNLNSQKTKIMASGPITSWQTDGETVATEADFIFPKSLQMVTAAMKLKDAYSLEGKLWST